MKVINPSEHAQPGIAVCTFNGEIVRVGPIGDLAAAGPFDTVHCHVADVEAVERSLQPPAAKPTGRKRRPKQQD
jgi:hypothetical protein